MTENNRTIDDLIKFWGSITVGAVLGAIGPWLQALLKLKLISDYFQPWVNAAASVFAALAFVVAFAYLRKADEERLRRILKVSFIVLLISAAICLGIRMTLGDVFAFGRLGTKLTWFFWIVAYIAVFVNLALTLCIVGFLSE
jgi:hypothetical protein